MKSGCRICGNPDLRQVHHVENVPVNDVLLMNSRDAATGVSAGDIDLVLCGGCGYIFNRCFDPARVEYSTRCEESQAYSARFNRFTDEIIQRIANRLPCTGQTVLEIGCGKGDFLTALCKGRGLTGIGVDPGYREREDGGERPVNVRFVTNEIEREAGLIPLADLVVCRHTLEHIDDPVRFLRFLRGRVHDEAAILFEVPDADSIFERSAFWDIYYEHCGYYSARSLSHLFDACGFHVDTVYAVFDDQYLILEATSGNGGAGAVPINDASSIDALNEHFTTRMAASLARWRALFMEWRRERRRVVLWGGGSKAVSLLSTLAIEFAVDYVVDINPRKQNKFLPGSGYEILPPLAIKSRPVDVVVVMNAIYEDEVRRELDEMNARPELYCMT